MEKSTDKALYFGIVAALCVSTFLHYAFGGSFEETPDYLSPLFGRYFPGNYHEVPGYIQGFVDAVLKFIFSGVLGFLIYKASLEIGFKSLWNEDIKKIESIFIIIFTGIIFGLLFIGYDTLTTNKYVISISLYGYSDFPSAIFKSFVMGINDEIQNKIWGIALISLIFSKIVKSDDDRNILFWVAAVICAIIYGIQNIQYSLAGYVRDISRMPLSMIALIAFPYALFSLVCAFFYKKYGLLSVIIIHILSDFIWRVIRVIFAYWSQGQNWFNLPW